MHTLPAPPPPSKLIPAVEAAANIRACMARNAEALGEKVQVERGELSSGGNPAPTI